MEQPTNPTVVDLQRRVAALEQSSLRWRRMASLTLGGWLVFLAVAAAPTADRTAVVEEITVRRLRLVDGDGKARAELAIDARGRGGLYVLDPAGKVRAEVTTDEDAALVMLRDLLGKNRLGLAVDKFPHLMLHDEFEKPRLHASVGITNSPSLVMIDDKGSFATGMGLDAKGQPWITPLLKIGAAGGEAKKESGGR